MSRRPLRVPQLDVDTPPRQPVSRPPDCVSSILKLPPDSRKPEDVDTTSDDHAYDAVTYFLLSRGPILEAPSVAPAFDENRHPGFELLR